ncbi:MAG: hypothetical protein PGN13_08420 [Patulibacter minatonensis]
MADWRETASPQTADDIEFVIGAALSEAERWLAEHGEFYPFGYVLTKTGEDAEIVMVDPSVFDGDQMPEAEAIADQIVAQFVDRRADLRAVAAASNVVGPEGLEVVRVSMEHADGVALDCFFGYDLAKQPLEVVDRQINEVAPQLFVAG